MSNTRIYRIWAGLKKRCNDKNNPIYGGKGIGYDKRWKDFSFFYEDMAEGYSDFLEIDRINNLKGYSKKNCRWANRKQQSKNRTSNVWITFNNKTMLQNDWAKEIGISPGGLCRRLKKWGIKKSLTRKVLPGMK